MGCRVVVEAALQAPSLTCGVILVDGSQFAAAMGAALTQQFAAVNGYETTTNEMFNDMFTARSNPSVTAAVVKRAKALPQPIGIKMMTDMFRYDVGRLAGSLACVRVPVMAIQTTSRNEKRERTTMRKGQTTPYLDMLGANLRSLRVDVIEDIGHFPQLDEPAQTNALIDSFLTSLPDR
jgi:pimeloyl-ACP methyl ester carboxylesterase